MGEEKTVFEQSIKQKGFFSYSDLYNFCFNWLKNEGYKTSEDEYTEKVSGSAKEILIKWKAKKKITDYYQYIIDVKWHILGMVEVEAEQNGQKVKMNKGEVKISLKGIVQRDWEETWDKNPFYKFLRGIYDRYIMRTTNDEYEDRLADKVESYAEEIKAFLNLEGVK